MRLHDWTIFPALLFATAFVPLALLAYGAARWALAHFNLGDGDQIGMAVVTSVAVVVSYNQAGDFVERQIRGGRGLS
jgi:hypothetical protein